MLVNTALATASDCAAMGRAFADAVDAVLEAGCRFEATLMLYGRNLSLSFDRSIPGQVALP